MPNANPVIIADPNRLEVLRSYCLLDTPYEPAFDRLTRLAARLLRVPVSLVGLIDADRQFYKSQVGLDEALVKARQIPVSQSYCQHVVVQAAPLIVEDARRHPLLYDNPAIKDFNAIAYAGIPLIESSGQVLGSFCVIDHQPRQWTEDEIDTLSELAASVMTEVELRAEIRERERIEAELRTSESRFRSVIATMHEGVVLQAHDSTIITANPAAERILGLTKDELTGRTSFDSRWQAINEDGSPFPGELHPAVVTLATGKPVSDVMMGIRKPGGELTWIMVSSVPLQDETSPIPHTAVTSFIDMTARKEAEEKSLQLEVETRRVHMLAQFIEHSSHEFRTPLTIIKASLSIMNRVEDPARRLQKTQVIEEQITRILRLVDSLQQMTSLDSSPSLKMVPTDIVRLVRSVTHEFQSSEPQRVTVHMHCDEGMPPVKADTDSLRDAIWQVLDNARRFSAEGGVVHVCTERQGDEAVIIVEDNGMGISAEHLPRVFERFYRQDTAHTTPGFGLGLSIAYSAVNRHGGTIAVESDPGVSTTVTIRLPLIGKEA